VARVRPRGQHIAGSRLEAPPPVSHRFGGLESNRGARLSRNPLPGVSF
jgi:hypothetical protein